MQLIDKEILMLAVPAVISNITVPLLGLSDTAIAGHLESALFLAAMGVGATMMNLSAWLFGFLRMGTAGIAAISFGAKDKIALSRLFCRTLFLGLLIGFLFLLFRKPLSSFLVGILNPGEEIAIAAGEYYRICIIAAPAQLGIMAMSGWMTGMQSTLWPMVVAIVTNIVNIPLSLWLVFGVGIGFRGLAIGTVAAQWIGFILALFFCFRLWNLKFGRTSTSESESIMSEWRNIFSKGGSVGFFSVNSNLIVRSACIMGVSMGMTYYGGQMGETQLAANTVLLQFFTFFSFFMDGFAHAAEALIGKAAGSRNHPELISVSKHIIFWSLGVGLTFTFIYGGGGITIATLLTNSGKVIMNIEGMKWVMWILPGISVGAFVYDGFFIGLTRTRPMLVATSVATLFFFIISAGFGGLKSPDILWLSFLGYLFIRALILAMHYPRTLRMFF